MASSIDQKDGVMRRILTGLLLVLAVGLLFSAGSASAASYSQACTYGPCGGTGTLTVTSVTQTPQGITTLKVTGSAFQPGETVDFYLGNSSVGDVNANATGAFSTTIVLPGGFKAGTYTLRAIGTKSGITATSNSFTLAGPTAGEQPCTASATTGGAAIVLAAAVHTTACLNTQVPSVNTATGAPSTKASNGLPFTGTDAVAIAMVGAVALGLGGVLVMTSRQRKANAFKR